MRQAALSICESAVHAHVSTDDSFHVFALEQLPCDGFLTRRDSRIVNHSLGKSQ
jgi:hypothetical protein